MGWPSPVLMETSCKRCVWHWVQDGMKRETLAGLDARSLSRGSDGHCRAASRSATRLLESPRAGEFSFFPSYTTEDVGYSSPILSSSRAKTTL